MNRTTVTVQANGEPFAISEGTPLDRFVESQGLSPAHVVVEHNGRALPRDAIAETVLNEGDRLEILRIVAGG
ncbi:MAG: sulfur carrier protein ThiS [Opitutales bacterium]|nr:sulfur carrier protein ThiS [Opitutales bacterium]